MLPKGFLELARTLIGVNTVSSEGTRQAADLLQALWEQAGLPVRRQVVEEVHVNILGGPGGEVAGPGGVLMVTHLDTVPPGPLERWQSDPWTLTERDGFLQGGSGAQAAGPPGPAPVLVPRHVRRGSGTARGQAFRG